MVTLHLLQELSMYPLATELIDPVDFFSTFIYRTMAIGTTLVGLFTGTLGSLLYLRKQSLISDVIGHSAIFGVLAAFVFATVALNINGRSLIVIIIGGTIAGIVSVLLTNWISTHTPLSSDVGMAICLSLFYGTGMAALQKIVRSNLPNRAGIDSFIFGNASTLNTRDLHTITICGTLCIIVVLVFWKEIKLFLFDETIAHIGGFSAKIMNPLILVTSTIAIVIGVKAVGMILMVAFTILPAAAARQWVHSFAAMFTLSGIIGAVCAFAGAYISVSIGKIPTGPVVVIFLFTVFLISVLFAPKRSLLMRSMKLSQVRKRLHQQLSEEAL